MQGTVFSSSVRFPVITEDFSIFVKTSRGGLRVIGVVVTKMLFTMLSPKQVEKLSQDSTLDQKNAVKNPYAVKITK